MQTRSVDVPEEILELLRGSRLRERSAADQVKSALTIHLLLEGLISIGKAAELAQASRLQFEALLVEMGLPIARYELGDYEQGLQGIAELDSGVELRLRDGMAVAQDAHRQHARASEVFGLGARPPAS